MSNRKIRYSSSFSWGKVSSLVRPNYDAEMRLSTFPAEHFGQSPHVRIPDLHAKVPFAFHY